jgi:hypothetical protein
MGVEPMFSVLETAVITAIRSGQNKNRLSVTKHNFVKVLPQNPMSRATLFTLGCKVTEEKVRPFM